jgi:transcription-repair coupling factor (superfamily II helicase)
MHPVVEAIRTTPAFRTISQRLPRSRDRLAVGGVVGSAGTSLVAALHEAHPHRIFLMVADDPEQAVRIEADLVSLLGEGTTHLYPQSEARFYGSDEDDPRIGGLRVEAVEALLGGDGRLFVTTARGLQERVAMPDRLATLHVELEVGDEIGLSLLVEELEAMGFEPAPLVEEVGQFAVRGGIVDVFSLGQPDPLRIEFWGDEIASIRLFDVADQRSTGELDSVQLLPATFQAGPDTGGTTRRSLLELLPDETLLVGIEGARWEEDLARHWTTARRIRADRQEGGESLPSPSRSSNPPRRRLADSVSCPGCE